MSWTASPMEVARAVEQCGFDSVTFGEHTHIPVVLQKASSFAPPVEVRKVFAAQFDPFVAMSAAAAVTERIQVGTAVTLVPEHHPIAMAKAIASVDHVSNGRLFLGIGAGWNDEVEAHGVPFEKRWAATREYVAAMRTIWRQEEPEFHGQFVDFRPIWCDPKPVQLGGPPILIGSNSKHAIRRVVDYGDGWLPTADDLDATAAGIALLRETATRAGRDFTSLRIEPMLFTPTRAGIERLIELGATRIHVGAPGYARPGEAAAAVKKLAELVEPFRKG